MSDPFKVLIRVRYGECDAQQVVFNARYGDYLDLASTEFFRALFGSYEALLADGYDCQVVRMLTEWASPARFDEVLCITVEATHLGNTSFTLTMTITERGSGRPVARAEVVYVLVDPQTYRKTPMPDGLREQLQAGARGWVVDQSGALTGPQA
ncbi:MAG: acyl-CoA thioesterase [Marinobacter sp.]|nr:acyl-CoA thioesterase [Marinobacter sp.]